MTHRADLSKETDPLAPEPVLAGRGDKLACSVSPLERRQALGWAQEGVERGPAMYNGLTYGPSQPPGIRGRLSCSGFREAGTRKLAFEAGGGEKQKAGE